MLSLGKVCGQMLTENADKQKIIKMMIGENIEAPSYEKKHITSDEVLMSVRDLCARDDRGAQLLNGVSFDLHPGEIIGIAALEGNGQAELAEVITGLRKASGGDVFVRDRKMDTSSAVDFIDAGVSCVPADRVAVVSVKEDPLYQNWILRKKDPPMRFGLLNYKKIKEEAKKAIADYDVRTTGIKQNSGLLSGGNMQKFILARELDKNPQVLVCSYPTRGLDIKATYFIRDTIESVKEKGVGVVLFSGEMDELFALSDRIIVLYKGKVVGELTPDAYNPYEVGRMMMGVSK